VLDDLTENENNITYLASRNSRIKKLKKSKIPTSSANKNPKTTKKPTKSTSTPNKANIDDENININLNTDNEENEDLKNKVGEDSGSRKLTDEESLEKMKELFPEDKGLTKTFITRKLKKRISIDRKLDFNDEETFKGVENTIPKKSGPNSFLKVRMEICNKEDFSLNSKLMFFMKDLFKAYFIFFKEKEKKMKIVIVGHITKDIISFLKKVSSEEFRNKYSVQTMKIRAYAFYEELINEFYKRENIIAKKINDAEIKDYIKQFDLITRMRKAYEEIKQLKTDKN